MPTRTKYLIFFIIIVVGVGLDQWTKQLANTQLAPYCNTEAPNYDMSQSGDCPYDHEAFFTWTHVYNDGAFLSLGSDWPPLVRMILLTVLPGILLIGVMVYMLRSNQLKKHDLIAFALIAAGGLGNIVDRVMAGKVVDFMHMNFGFARTGIFNVADLYIVFGISVYVIGLIVTRNHDKGDEPPAEGGIPVIADANGLGIEIKNTPPDLPPA